MTNPGLCVTVTADTTAGLREARDRVTDADLVELRLDTVRDPDVAAALEGRRRPVIVTCRPPWEGGQFRGSESEREALLGEALALGAEYVDIEFRAGFSRLLDCHADRIVLSSHDFEGVPADLADRARAMHGTGAGVVKIAAKTSRLTDCLPLLELGKTFGRDRRQVVIGMGDAGLATRVLPGRFHSAWTYAGSLSGIGQLTADLLLRHYRFRTLTDDTSIFGLTGFPIGHSVSPAMHNAACAATGLNGVYLPLPAETADEFLAFATALGVAGVSITIPHKVALFERADAVDETARAIGAINTLKREGPRWVGMNSDLPGFLQPLASRGASLKHRRVAILGAGGAARAVAMGAAAGGADVTVHARDLEKARPVAVLGHGRAAAFPPAADSWDVLVNCTPIGMHPHVDASPVELSRDPGSVVPGSRTSDAEPRASKIVYDLIYNPLETRLLRDARALGYTTIGGLDMLVAQAMAQFRWWTGRDPEAAPMRAAAMARLAEFNHP